MVKKHKLATGLATLLLGAGLGVGLQMPQAQAGCHPAVSCRAEEVTCDENGYECTVISQYAVDTSWPDSPNKHFQASSSLCGQKKIPGNFARCTTPAGGCAQSIMGAHC